MMRFPVYIAGCMLLVAAGTVAADNTTRVPLPEITKGKGEQCVEPVDVMRREHMNFIQHQRDQTVRKGIRADKEQSALTEGPKYSLTGCVNCHTKRDDAGKYIPIDAEGQFCESCHKYTAVTIDCFQCHRTTPDENPGNAAIVPKQQLRPMFKKVDR